MPAPTASEDRIDQALATMVASYTDTAPPTPDVNQVLLERANRRTAAPTTGERWMRPMLVGTLGVILAVGVVAAIVATNSNGGQSIVPADVDESDGETDNDTNGNTTDGNDSNENALDDESDGGFDPGFEPVDADEVLGPLPSESTEPVFLDGTENAGALPDAAPSTYWTVLRGELVQVDARTGEVLTILGGWERPETIGEGDVIQALESPEVAPDGSLYIDDCCTPEFGTIYKLGPDEQFDSGIGWVTGRTPVVSPSGDLVMIAIGQATEIYRSEGSPVTGIGDVPFDSGTPRFVPLAWIDESTVAVRVMDIDDQEQIRIYDLDDNVLVEREDARRSIADRFYMDAATRADGMLVVAGRRPNGDSLGLAGGGDLVAEIIDPATGELVTEFDLPDRVFDIDYDRSGRFLLASGDDGVLHWFGAGGSGILAEGVGSASWD